MILGGLKMKDLINIKKRQTKEILYLLDFADELKENLLHMQKAILASLKKRREIYEA